MTTCQKPDYDVVLMIEPTQFTQISGIFLDVSVAFGGRRQRVDGMLCVPRLIYYSEASKTCEGWLWAEVCTDMDLSTEVDIQIIDSWDPRLMPEKRKQLLPYFGLHLKGKITKNRDFELLTTAIADKPHR